MDYEGSCRATKGEITGSPTARPRQSLGHGAQGSLDQRLCVPAFRSGLPFSKLSGLRVNASHSAFRISLTLLMHVCNLSRSKRGRGDAATNGISWETDGQGFRTRQTREYPSGETPFGLDVTGSFLGLREGLSVVTAFHRGQSAESDWQAANIRVKIRLPRIVSPAAGADVSLPLHHHTPGLGVPPRHLQPGFILPERFGAVLICVKMKPRAMREG